MWLYNSFHIGPEHFFLFFVGGEPSTESLLLRVGFSLVAVHGLLTAVASPVAQHRL